MLSVLSILKLYDMSTVHLLLKFLLIGNLILKLEIILKIKVKQSRYRPGVAQRVPGFHDNSTGRLYRQEILLIPISVRD